MTDDHRSRGFKYLLAHCLLAGAFAVPAGAAPRTNFETDAEVDTIARELDDDIVEDAVESFVTTTEPARAADQLARLLESVHPLDATRIAALAALSSHADVRLAVAEALATRLRILGGGLVLDQLRDDIEPDVRAAATRAAAVRAARLDRTN